MRSLTPWVVFSLLLSLLSAQEQESPAPTANEAEDSEIVETPIPPPIHLSEDFEIPTLPGEGEKEKDIIPSDPNPDRGPAFDEIEAAPPEEETSAAETEKLTQKLKPDLDDDGVRVSVLGYHDFSNSKPNTEMRIQTNKFRKQMSALKNLGKPIITMEEFVKWKRGEGTLPPQCFLVTIDDGWKTVYTEAYPVLKEYKIPFTLFLYKKYVSGGSRALTKEMIDEMLASGLCSIGSHSVTHPIPSVFRAAAKKGPDENNKFLLEEFGESKIFLEKTFGRPIPTYAYPGGFITEAMYPVAKEVGYEFLFSVNPGMTQRDSENLTLPRYIILGDKDGIFRIATTFRPTGGTAAGSNGINIQTTRHPVLPTPGYLTANRLPLIAADLSKEKNIEPESIVMRVSGFGKIPATWDSENQTSSWRVNRSLRAPQYEVSLQWRLKGNREFELPMRWTFQVDLEAGYQPR